MGDGLPLNKIANNNIVELNVDFELTAAQARLLAKVLEDKHVVGAIGSAVA